MSETLSQVFFCEFCEIFKNTFSYRRPLVAASVFVMILNLKGFQVLCSQYFQVLEICLSIFHISKTIVKFFERFHFGIILPVML